MYYPQSNSGGQSPPAAMPSVSPNSNHAGLGVNATNATSSNSTKDNNNNATTTTPVRTFVQPSSSTTPSPPSHISAPNLQQQQQHHQQEGDDSRQLFEHRLPNNNNSNHHYNNSVGVVVAGSSSATGGGGGAVHLVDESRLVDVSAPASLATSGGGEAVGGGLGPYPRGRNISLPGGGGNPTESASKGTVISNRTAATTTNINRNPFTTQPIPQHHHQVVDSAAAAGGMNGINTAAGGALANAANTTTTMNSSAVMTAVTVPSTSSATAANSAFARSINNSFDNSVNNDIHGVVSVSASSAGVPAVLTAGGNRNGASGGYVGTSNSTLGDAPPIHQHQHHPINRRSTMNSMENHNNNNTNNNNNNYTATNDSVATSRMPSVSRGDLGASLSSPRHGGGGIRAVSGRNDFDDDDEDEVFVIRKSKHKSSSNKSSKRGGGGGVGNTSTNNNNNTSVSTTTTATVPPTTTAADMEMLAMMGSGTTDMLLASDRNSNTNSHPNDHGHGHGGDGDGPMPLSLGGNDGDSSQQSNGTTSYSRSQSHSLHNVHHAGVTASTTATTSASGAGAGGVGGGGGFNPTAAKTMPRYGSDGGLGLSSFLNTPPPPPTTSAATTAGGISPPPFTPTSPTMVPHGIHHGSHHNYPQQQQRGGEYHQQESMMNTLLSGGVGVNSINFAGAPIGGAGAGAGISSSSSPSSPHHKSSLLMAGSQSGYVASHTIAGLPILGRPSGMGGSLTTTNNNSSSVLPVLATVVAGGGPQHPRPHNYNGNPFSVAPLHSTSFVAASGSQSPVPQTLVGSMTSTLNGGHGSAVRFHQRQQQMGGSLRGARNRPTGPRRSNSADRADDGDNNSYSASSSSSDDSTSDTIEDDEDDDEGLAAGARGGNDGELSATSGGAHIPRNVSSTVYDSTSSATNPSSVARGGGSRMRHASRMSRRRKKKERGVCARFLRFLSKCFGCRKKKKSKHAQQQLAAERDASSSSSASSSIAGFFKRTFLSIRGIIAMVIFFAMVIACGVTIILTYFFSTATLVDDARRQSFELSERARKSFEEQLLATPSALLEGLSYHLEAESGGGVVGDPSSSSSSSSNSSSSAINGSDAGTSTLRLLSPAEAQNQSIFAAIATFDRKFQFYHANNGAPITASNSIGGLLDDSYASPLFADETIVRLFNSSTVEGVGLPERFGGPSGFHALSAEERLFTERLLYTGGGSGGRGGGGSGEWYTAYVDYFIAAMRSRNYAVDFYASFEDGSLISCVANASTVRDDPLDRHQPLSESDDDESAVSIDCRIATPRFPRYVVTFVKGQAPNVTRLGGDPSSAAADTTYSSLSSMEAFWAYNKGLLAAVLNASSPSYDYPAAANLERLFCFSVKRKGGGGGGGKGGGGGEGVGSVLSTTASLAAVSATHADLVEYASLGNTTTRKEESALSLFRKFYFSTNAREWGRSGSSSISDLQQGRVSMGSPYVSAVLSEGSSTSHSFNGGAATFAFDAFTAIPVGINGDGIASIGVTIRYSVIAAQILEVILRSLLSSSSTASSGSSSSSVFHPFIGTGLSIVGADIEGKINTKPAAIIVDGSNNVVGAAVARTNSISSFSDFSLDAFHSVADEQFDAIATERHWVPSTANGLLASSLLLAAPSSSSSSSSSTKSLLSSLLPLITGGSAAAEEEPSSRCGYQVGDAGASVLLRCPKTVEEFGYAPLTNLLAAVNNDGTGGSSGGALPKSLATTVFSDLGGDGSGDYVVTITPIVPTDRAAEAAPPSTAPPTTTPLPAGSRRRFSPAASSVDNLLVGLDWGLVLITPVDSLLNDIVDTLIFNLWTSAAVILILFVLVATLLHFILRPLTSFYEAVVASPSAISFMIYSDFLGSEGDERANADDDLIGDGGGRRLTMTTAVAGGGAIALPIPPEDCRNGEDGGVCASTNKNRRGGGGGTQQQKEEGRSSCKKAGKSSTANDKHNNKKGSSTAKRKNTNGFVGCDAFWSHLYEVELIMKAFGRLQGGFREVVSYVPQSVLAGGMLGGGGGLAGGGAGVGGEMMVNYDDDDEDGLLALGYYRNNRQHGRGSYEDGVPLDVAIIEDDDDEGDVSSYGGGGAQRNGAAVDDDDDSEGSIDLEDTTDMLGPTILLPAGGVDGVVAGPASMAGGDTFLLTDSIAEYHMLAEAGAGGGLDKPPAHRLHNHHNYVNTSSNKRSNSSSRNNNNISNNHSNAPPHRAGGGVLNNSLSVAAAGNGGGRGLTRSASRVQLEDNASVSHRGGGGSRQQRGGGGGNFHHQPGGGRTSHLPVGSPNPHLSLHNRRVTILALNVCQFHAHLGACPTASAALLHGGVDFNSNNHANQYAVPAAAGGGGGVGGRGTPSSASAPPSTTAGGTGGGSLPPLVSITSFVADVVNCVERAAHEFRGIADGFQGDRFVISFNAVNTVANHACSAAGCANAAVRHVANMRYNKQQHNQLLHDLHSTCQQQLQLQLQLQQHSSNTGNVSGEQQQFPSVGSFTSGGVPPAAAATSSSGLVTATTLTGSTTLLNTSSLNGGNQQQQPHNATINSSGNAASSTATAATNNNINNNINNAGGVLLSAANAPTYGSHYLNTTARRPICLTGGIATGLVLVGNMGSSAMKRFTILGPAVGNAWTLERIAKRYMAKGIEAASANMVAMANTRFAVPQSFLDQQQQQQQQASQLRGGGGLGSAVLSSSPVNGGGVGGSCAPLLPFAPLFMPESVVLMTQDTVRDTEDFYDYLFVDAVDLPTAGRALHGISGGGHRHLHHHQHHGAKQHNSLHHQRLGMNTINTVAHQHQQQQQQQQQQYNQHATSNSGPTSSTNSSGPNHQQVHRVNSLPPIATQQQQQVPSSLASSLANTPLLAASNASMQQHVVVASGAPVSPIGALQSSSQWGGGGGNNNNTNSGAVTPLPTVGGVRASSSQQQSQFVPPSQQQQQQQQQQSLPPARKFIAVLKGQKGSHYNSGGGGNPKDSAVFASSMGGGALALASGGGGGAGTEWMYAIEDNNKASRYTLLNAAFLAVMRANVAMPMPVLASATATMSSGGGGGGPHFSSTGRMASSSSHTQVGGTTIGMAAAATTTTSNAAAMSGSANANSYAAFVAASTPSPPVVIQGGGGGGGGGGDNGAAAANSQQQQNNNNLYNTMHHNGCGAEDALRLEGIAAFEAVMGALLAGIESVDGGGGGGDDAFLSLSHPASYCERSVVKLLQSLVVTTTTTTTAASSSSHAPQPQPQPQRAINGSAYCNPLLDYYHACVMPIQGAPAQLSSMMRVALMGAGGGADGGVFSSPPTPPRGSGIPSSQRLTSTSPTGGNHRPTGGLHVVLGPQRSLSQFSSPTSQTAGAFPPPRSTTER